MQQLSQEQIREELFKLPNDELSKIVIQANQWADYIKYTRMMEGVAYQMKETPAIPSEQPKDVSPLTKVEFPEGGGVLTYMEDMDLPYQGYPHYEFVDKIDIVKKTSRAFISGLYHRLKNKKFLLITLIPSLWFFKDLFRSSVYVYYRMVDRFKIKTDRYCIAMRELHRAMTVAKGEETLRLQLRDLVCMILEMDNAYRFRFQDIVSELSKESLRKNPIKELTRLLSLMQTREHRQDVNDTWTLLKYVVSFYLRFDKGLREIIVNSLLEADLDKLKLIDNDKCYCAPRRDYTFGFQINPTESDRKLIEKSTKQLEFKEAIIKIKDDSTKDHQEMLKRHQQEMEKVSKDTNANALMIILKARHQKEINEMDEKYGQLLNTAQGNYDNFRANMKHELGLL